MTVIMEHLHRRAGTFTGDCAAATSLYDRLLPGLGPRRFTATEEDGRQRRESLTERHRTAHRASELGSTEEGPFPFQFIHEIINGQGWIAQMKSRVYDRHGSQLRSQLRAAVGQLAVVLRPRHRRHCLRHASAAGSEGSSTVNY